MREKKFMACLIQLNDFPIILFPVKVNGLEGKKERKKIQKHLTFSLNIFLQKFSCRGKRKMLEIRFTGA